MRPVRVHIGTTEGPSEVQRLTPEAPEIRSVVCLDGRAVALPISRDYEGFVRRPTGIVERLWGGPAFRMDVGARITDGLSWQLGAFIAHGLFAAGALAERGTEAAVTVWATGEVDASLAIRPVADIARKLELSAELLGAAASSRPWVMVPAEAAELASATLARLGLAQSCRVLGVGTGGEALAAIGLALPGVAPIRSPSLRPIRSPRRGRLAALLALAIALPVGAAAGWIAWDWRRTVMTWTDQARAGELIALDDRLTAMAATPSCLTCAVAVRLFRDWLVGRAPPQGAPIVQTEEVRRSAYGGCLATSSSPAPAPVTLAAPAGGVAVSVGACRVRYLASGAPSVALIVSSPALRLPSDNVASGAGEASVTLSLPPLFIYPTEQRVIALAAAVPLESTIAWLRPLLPTPPAPVPEAVVVRLASLGVAMRILRHRVDPERGM